MGLESILGTVDLWPILLALTALPAVFQLVTLPICPESPKYLLINKEEAISAQRGGLGVGFSIFYVFDFVSCRNFMVC